MKNIFLTIIAILFLFQACKVAEKAPKGITVAKGNVVLISTKYGNIKLKLYDETPLHKANFIKLVKEHYLDSTLFHRVINHFMIQGGDPDSKHAVAGAMLGNGDLPYKVPAEFIPSLYHKKGVLAAAREGDNVNPTKASSGCQFYIVQGNVFTNEQLDNIEKKLGKKYTEEQRRVYTTIGGTPHLDGNYTVFGEVISGLDVVDKIAAVKTDKNNRPLEDIQMMVSFVEN